MLRVPYPLLRETKGAGAMGSKSYFKMQDTMGELATEILFGVINTPAVIQDWLYL